MLTSEFMNSLKSNQEKAVLFHIDEHLVPATYHVSEIKKLHIESMDCGGKSHKWNENVFHIFIPNSPEQIKPVITNFRFNSIFESTGALPPDAELTVEYSKAQNEPLANYKISKAEETESDIRIYLQAKTAECKPVSGGSCKPKAANTGGCCS